MACGTRKRNTPLIFLLGFLSSSMLLAQDMNQEIEKTPSRKRRERLKCESVLEYSERAKFRDELTRRREINFLIRAFKASRDDCQKEWIVAALYQIQRPKDHRIMQFMRSIATTDTGEQTWLALQYLAEEGDRNALAILNRNCYRYHVPSMAWGDTLVLFGRYKYRPAIPCLVRSIGSVAGEQAIEGLRLLFPGCPSDFGSIEEAQAYFERYAREEERSRVKQHPNRKVSRKPSQR